MKKVSLAIYWHMHQPTYEIEGTYLMPWSRLHAVKDYLDMVLFLEKYPKLKLNIDIVPALLDTIIDYVNGANDIHSELTLTDTETMEYEEKAFVLNNFFTLKFETMLCKSENYCKLYEKRFANDNCNPDEFSSQEISDLMALYNLAWIDTVHYEKFPKLKELWNKQYNYSLEDRIEIIDIHRQIMAEIIPTYKKYLDEGRIELTASSYYHAILPILIDMKYTLRSVPTRENLPSTLKMRDYAVFQVRKALNRIEELFNFRPKGFWSPELCVGPKTLQLLAKEGIEWTIADESTLSKSINFEFVRDFKGNLNDPYHLLQVYQYNTKQKNIDVIFRDRSIPNLINFEYAELNSKAAAKDLYDKIKIVQNKLLVSPDDNHLLTIAMDGENCWENYENDGNDFLNNFYEAIENDDSIDTVLISNYISSAKNKKALSKITVSNGVDNDFHYWIGDEIKNKAWKYIKEAKEALEQSYENECSVESMDFAKRELMIAQGSDWFWWYGEPNNSGQDFVFDYMFREHLKGVYIALNMDVPNYLDESLITRINIPFKRPSCNISPKMDGLFFSENDWYNSGVIQLLDGPVHRENKTVEKINFGCDNNNMYFRLYINKNSSKQSYLERINQFYIYTRNATKSTSRAYIRLISKTDNNYPLLNEKFENEITLTLIGEKLYPPRLATCIYNNVWTLANPEFINIVYNDVIDLTIPFNTVGIAEGETVEFFITNTDSGVKNSNIHQEILFTMRRD
ncbi:hypothetical protein IJO12_05190 [bacterium]|nr:hypothetical protein [bacterium]